MAVIPIIGSLHNNSVSNNSNKHKLRFSNNGGRFACVCFRCHSVSCRLALLSTVGSCAFLPYFLSIRLCWKVFTVLTLVCTFFLVSWSTTTCSLSSRERCLASSLDGSLCTSKSTEIFLQCDWEVSACPGCGLACGHHSWSREWTHGDLGFITGDLIDDIDDGCWWWLFVCEFSGSRFFFDT